LSNKLDPTAPAITGRDELRSPSYAATLRVKAM
jgi:hypothetical protein